MALGMDARATFLAIVKGDVSDAVQKFDKLGNTVDRTTGKSTTTIGKFKNFTKGAMAEVGASMTTLGLTAGLAFARIAQVGAKEFMDLAKASRDLAVATGLTTEEASRWIEVSGDFGVESEALRTAIGKLNRTLTPEVAARYGIALTDASGQARSANDIFIDVLESLNQTQNAGDRARKGTARRGRGWQSLAPVLGRSRTEYEDLLQSVRDGQVITEEEADNAQELRVVLQDLSDEYSNLKLELGATAAEGAPVLRFFSQFLEARRTAIQRDEILNTNTYSDALTTLSDALQIVGDGFNWAFGSDKRSAADEAATTLQRMGSPDTIDRLAGLGPILEDAGSGFQFIGQNIGGVNDELDYLLGLISDEERVLALQEGLADVTGAAVEYWNAVKDGTDEADSKGREYQQTALDLKRDVLLAIGEIDNVPTSVVTRISGLLDKGSFDQAVAEITGLLSGEVRFGYTGRIIDYGIDGERAMGGPVSGGGTYLVGERGPELFMPSSSGTIIPNGSLGGNVTVVINNPVSSGEQIANELAAYVRRNGTRFLQGVG
jgi:hypothetical protein